MCKDKLDYLIGLASAGCGDDDVEMFNNLDTSEVVLDREFYRIRDRRIRKYKRDPLVKMVQRILARVAIFILAVVSATTVTVAAVPSLRKALFGAIVEWYVNYLTINYEIPKFEGDEPDSESNMDSIIESEDHTETANNNETGIVRPTKIEQVRKPSYYQEGLIEDVVVESKTQILIDYYVGNDLIYSYKQLVFSEDEMYVDNEAAVVSNIEIEGCFAYLVEYTDISSKKIIWADSLYIYQLSAVSCDLQTLIAVAESLK